MRKMCFDCPFNPESSTFRFRDDWLEELERMRLEEPTDLPQGCHILPDGQNGGIPFQENPELQCVGHIAHMKTCQNRSGALS